MTSTTTTNRSEDDNQLSLFDAATPEDAAGDQKPARRSKPGARNRAGKEKYTTRPPERDHARSIENGENQDEEESGDGARPAGTRDNGKTAGAAAGECATEELARAYDRYVEVIDSTYDSRFSAAKRNAAFKEAAREHGVRVADLKRYSTAAALGIPYERVAIGYRENGSNPEGGDEH